MFELRSLGDDGDDNDEDNKNVWEKVETPAMHGCGVVQSPDDFWLWQWVIGRVETHST